MLKINFTKMIASGNDFIVTRLPHYTVTQLKILAQRFCDRKYGIGADGLLILEKSKIADIRMRIFNPDGSEAEMCGNGARCIALFKAKGKKQKAKVGIETKAGVIKSEVDDNNIKIKLTDPREIKLDFPIHINGRNLKVNFIDTGVPHTVIFVEGLDKIDIVKLGRQIRYHKRFIPAGTNVDFVEVKDNQTIKIRTYERGVEDETLACGTGVVASALITRHKDKRMQGHKSQKINVQTKSAEILKVYFDKIDSKFKNVWLEGKAEIVYKGEYYV